MARYKREISRLRIKQQALKQAVSKSIGYFADRLTPLCLSNALSIVKEELFEGARIPQRRIQSERSKQFNSKKLQTAGMLPNPQIAGAHISQNTDSGGMAAINQLSEKHQLNPNLHVNQLHRQVINHSDDQENPLNQVNSEDFSFFACSGRIPLRDTDAIWSEFKPIILRIIELLPLDSSEVEGAIRPFIGRFIAWSLDLPASECYHHYERGGLVRHSLETALLSLQYAQDVAADLGLSPKEQRESATIFMLLAFAGGLLHDAGKVLSDLVVIAGATARVQGEVDFPESEASLWNPITCSLMEFLDLRKAGSYFFRYRPGRGKNHETMAQIMADRIIPDAFMTLILRDTHGVCELFGALTCNDKGRLYQIIKKADIASVLADLGSRRFGMTHQGRMLGAFERFILIIQDRLRREPDLINTRDGWLFLIGNEVYLSLNTHVYLDLLRPLMRAGLAPAFRDRTGFYEALVNRGIGGRRDSIIKRVVSSFMVAIGDELYLKHGCLIIKPEYFLGDAVRPAPLPLVHPEIYRAFTLIVGNEHIFLPDPTLIPAGVMMESQISVSRISAVSEAAATDKPEKVCSDFFGGCSNREQGEDSAGVICGVSTITDAIAFNEKEDKSGTFTDESAGTDGIKITECLKLLERQGIELESPFGVPLEGIYGNEIAGDESDQDDPTASEAEPENESEAENDQKDKKDDFETRLDGRIKQDQGDKQEPESFPAGAQSSSQSGLQGQSQFQSLFEFHFQFPWISYAPCEFGNWQYSLNPWGAYSNQSKHVLKGYEAWSIPGAVSASGVRSQFHEMYLNTDFCVLEVKAKWSFEEQNQDGTRNILFTAAINFGIQGEIRYDSINYSFGNPGDSCDAINCTCNHLREAIAALIAVSAFAKTKGNEDKTTDWRPDNRSAQNKEAKQSVNFNVQENIKIEINKSRQGDKGKLVDKSARVEKSLRGDKIVADAQRPDKKRNSIFDARRKAAPAWASIDAMDRLLGLGGSFMSNTGIPDKNRAERPEHIESHIQNHIHNQEQNVLPTQKLNIEKEITQVTKGIQGEEFCQSLNNKASLSVNILQDMQDSGTSASRSIAGNKGIDGPETHPSGIFKIPGYVGGVRDISDGGLKKPSQALFYEPYRRRVKAQSRPKEAFLSAGVTPKSRLPQDFWINIPAASEDKDESACADDSTSTGAKKISSRKAKTTAGTTNIRVKSRSKKTTASVSDIHIDEAGNETNNETRLEFEIKSKTKHKAKQKSELELSELIDNPLQLAPAPPPRKRDARGRFVSSKASA